MHLSFDHFRSGPVATSLDKESELRRRYLLGELSEREQASLEERYFSNDEASSSSWPRRTSWLTTARAERSPIGNASTWKPGSSCLRMGSESWSSPER